MLPEAGGWVGRRPEWISLPVADDASTTLAPPGSSWRLTLATVPESDVE